MARPASRMPERSAATVLTMRRVYVLPSRAGVAYVALLVLMLVGAINYTLGLGFALTFFAGSCAIVDMVLTVRNLAGLRLLAGRAQPVFAGEEAQFELQLHNDGQADRCAIRIGFHPAGTPWRTQSAHAVDVAAGASTAVTLTVPASRRGWLVAPPVRLTTRFPLGLFGAWSNWQPDLRVLVYPFPEQDAPPLPSRGDASAEGHGTVGLDNFAGIRSYQPGDPMRHLAWRQIARLHPEDGGQLVTKHFDGGAVAELLLDFADLPLQLDLELRLARMAQWVLQAEARALPYAFRLGHHHYPAALGDAHRAACLRALALYGDAGGT
ncbi:DUF58 domain-containing protein [Massilia sp. YMA4]|uniref:DUF58 domain-containing protein n=1 Tax=Massilia sp. YMA4 TaxID=1593482 RepID=UPI000DD18577|nr:DUF58 domain-containing protein [Massilia sp. YMA4]AXA91915.1 hypothetical protein DPH57_12630 [Massilia sp. YMA4]